MYSLINFNNVLHRGGVTNLTVNRLVESEKQQIENVIDFYRKYRTLGPSDSPILRLLYDMTMSEEKGALDYYGYFRYETVYSAYGFTSHSSEGILHEGIWYGEAKVAILAESASGIADIAATRWQDLQPLKVIRHPGLKYSLSRPDLAPYEEDDFAILYLDTGILGYMYGKWARANALLPEDKQERPEDFLARYVYPNMIWSQYNQVMLNALSSDPTDLLDLSENPTPILTTKKTLDFADNIIELVESLGEGSTFEQILENTPVPEGENILEHLVNPRSTYTLQTHWLLMASSLPIILAAAKYSSDNPERKTIRHLYDREMRALKMQGIINKISDRDIRDKIREDLDTLSIYML